MKTSIDYLWDFFNNEKKIGGNKKNFFEFLKEHSLFMLFFMYFPFSPIEALIIECFEYFIHPLARIKSFWKNLY